MPELPNHVVAHLHGGPHDGETIDQLPWARLEIRLPQWDDMVPGDGEDVYALRPPWRGQSVAHYDFVEPVTNDALTPTDLNRKEAL